MLTFEFPEPKEPNLCECCGGLTTTVTRFVYKEGDAFAIYYASFTDNHPTRLVKALIGMGEWGEGADVSTRRAVAVILWQTESQYQVSVVDAAESPWKSTKVLGRILDRDEALKDAAIKEVFHITDHMVEEDPVIRAYFNSEQRASF